MPLAVSDGTHTVARPGKARRAWPTVAVVFALLIVYNANGREIGSVDSEPTKFAARELLLHHTLTLNHFIGAIPQYARRPAFVHARGGVYRSAYSPVSSILTAGLTWPFWKAGLIDVRAPRAPGVMAVATASLLTALAVAIAFQEARRRASVARALAVAAGFGLGTGLWNAVSRTLWVHETAIFGLMIAVFAFAGEEPVGWAAGVGLALAGAARPQLAPIIAALLAGIWFRAGWRQALAAASVVGTAAAVMMIANERWFGSPFGPLAAMADVNNVLHRTSSTFAADWRGLAGLLVSPSRGLLVFSPVAAIGLWVPGGRSADRWRQPFAWCALAAAAQWAMYGSYSVWWGGHTFGPRYMLDVLPLLVPAAAVAAGRLRLRSAAGAAACAALAWSILVAATGAFVYPNDRWNSDPTDIDRDHARLWSWSDNQLARSWKTAPSPQNFELFARDTLRVPEQARRR
ncbi:MAG TPA: hypothetical protein VL309_00575 [Vicinamibacterales bacterium]|jgi:hypothetical protein|nr:hypothetical protein [Vicinamibacterales bacterium]